MITIKTPFLLTQPTTSAFTLSPSLLASALLGPTLTSPFLPRFSQGLPWLYRTGLQGYCTSSAVFSTFRAAHRSS